MPVRETVLAVKTDNASIANAAKQLNSLADAGKIDDSQLKKATVNLNALAAEAKVTAKQLADTNAAMQGLSGEAFDQAQVKATKLEKKLVDLESRSETIPTKLGEGYERAAKKQEAAITKQAAANAQQEVALQKQAAARELAAQKQDTLTQAQEASLKSLKALASANVIDAGQLDVAIKKFNALQAESESLAHEISKIEVELDGLEGEQLIQQRVRAAKLESVYAKVNNEIERLPRELEEAAEKQARLNRLSEQYDEGRSSAQRRFAAYGDIDTAAQTLGGAIGGGAGDTLRTVGDLSAVTEQIGLMGEAAVSTAKGVASSTGALGSIAQSALAAVPALGAAGAGFLAIGVAVAAVAVAAAPLVIGLKMISDRSKEAARNAERMAEAVASQSEATAEVQAAIWNDDLEGAVAAAERLNEERIRLLLEKNDLERRVGELDGKERDKAEEKLKEVRDEMVNVTLASKAAEEALAPYADEVERIRYANSEAGQAEKELALKREQAAQTIAQLNQREQDLQHRRAQAEADLAEDRGVRDAREREDYAETIAKTQKRVQDIQVESAKRITDIRADAAKQEVAITKKTAKSLADVAASSSKSIADVQAKTQQDSAKSYAKFLKDRRRAEEDYQDQSFNAIINNDVLALKQAQSARQKDRQRAQEDFNEETAERQVQAQQRVAEIRNESAIRIAEIKAGALAERQELAVSLRERIAGEKEAVKERLKAEEEAAKEQEKARAKRLERQAEDDKRADERSKRAHEEELGRIDAERQAQQQALLAVQQGATNVITAVGQSNNAVIAATAAAATNAINQIGRAGSSSGTGSRASTTSFTPDIALAEGAIIPANTYVPAHFESQRNYEEVVLPLNRQTLERVLPDGFNSGPSVTYGDIYIGAGNNVTREDVRNIMFEVVGAQMRGIQRARTGA